MSIQGKMRRLQRIVRTSCLIITFMSTTGCGPSGMNNDAAAPVDAAADLSLMPAHDQSAAPDLQMPDLLPPSDLIPPFGTDASLCVNVSKPPPCVPRKQAVPLPQYLQVPPMPLRTGIGDLDGDGLNDLVVADAYSERVTVLLNHGDGTFPTRGMYGLPDPSEPAGIEVRDIDNDGDADVLVAGSNYPLAVLKNLGGGVLDHYVRYDSSSRRTSYARVLALSDINCDGFVDIIIQSAYLLNRGDGTFQKPIYIGDAMSSTFYQSNFGDMNGDGWPDLVTRQTQDVDKGGTLSVLSSRGGVFLPVFTGLFTLGYVELADLNRDSRLDAMLVEGAALGDGFGNLGKPLGAPPFIGAESVLADINNDGIIDRVATGAQMGPEVTLGRGDGSFGPSLVSQPRQLGGRHPVIGDLDGDCWPEVVTADAVTIWVNQHNGTFK